MAHLRADAQSELASIIAADAVNPFSLADAFREGSDAIRAMVDRACYNALFKPGSDHAARIATRISLLPAVRQGEEISPSTIVDGPSADVDGLDLLDDVKGSVYASLLGAEAGSGLKPERPANGMLRIKVGYRIKDLAAFRVGEWEDRTLRAYTRRADVPASVKVSSAWIPIGNQEAADAGRVLECEARPDVFERKEVRQVFTCPSGFLARVKGLALRAASTILAEARPAYNDRRLRLLAKVAASEAAIREAAEAADGPSAIAEAEAVQVECRRAVYRANSRRSRRWSKTTEAILAAKLLAVVEDIPDAAIAKELKVSVQAVRQAWTRYAPEARLAVAEAFKVEAYHEG